MASRVEASVSRIKDIVSRIKDIVSWEKDISLSGRETEARGTLARGRLKNPSRRAGFGTLRTLPTFFAAFAAGALTLAVLFAASGATGFADNPLDTEVSITGTVTDSDGNALPRVGITVYDDPSGELLSSTILTNDLGQFSTTVSVPTTIGGADLPTQFWVDRVYPNPVAAGRKITLRYTTPGNRKVEPELEVFDVLGRRVNLPGELAAGMYFYRLRFDPRNVSETRDFVVTGGGSIQIELEQSFSASAGPTQLRSRNTMAKSRDAASIRVTAEKSGLVAAEAIRSVGNEIQLQINFEMDAAPAPTVSFAVSGTPAEGRVVQFDGSGSSGAAGEELAYLWDFGTTARGSGQKVAYVFPDAGTYSVNLTVTGAYGASASSSQDVVVAAGPDATGMTTVSALVYDHTGVPIQDATVSVAGQENSAVTDGVGLAVLDAAAGVPLTLRVSKTGFTSQSVQLKTEEDQSPSLVQVTLHPRATPVIFPDVQNGGSVEGEDGARVALPFDALADSEGNPVDGHVEVSLTSLDVISDEIEAFPGRFEGITPDGEQGLIVSFGVTEFALTQNGEELQLAPTKTADIEIPVYSPRATLGEEIPLWSVDEETGAWIQEGTGTVVGSASSPTGLALRATVGHFSWYNIDVLGCGRSSDTGMAAAAVTYCRDGETGEAIPCWAKVRVSDEGVSPSGLVPRGGISFRLCGGWSTIIKAWADPGPLVTKIGRASQYRSGSVEVPPLGAGDTVEVVIPLSPLDIGEAVAINYGDIINARIEGDEIDRYAIQGTTGDLVRLGVTRRTSGDLDGQFRFLDPTGAVLREYEFFDRVRFRFETLEMDGEYLAEVMRVPLENDGPYRLQISRYEPMDTVIALNSRENEFVWPNKTDIWRFDNDQPRTVQVRGQAFFSVSDSVFSNLGGQLVTRDPSGNEIAAGEFARHNAVFNLDLEIGEHVIEVGASSPGSNGEYHVDIEEIVLENGIRQIAYGDSLLWAFASPGGTKQYEFDGSEGDVIRLDVEDTGISSSRVSWDAYLIGAVGDTLDSDDNRDNIAFRIPATGTYTISVDVLVSRQDFGDYAMPFSVVTSPDPVPIPFGSAVRQQSWDGIVSVNRYTFDGLAGTPTEIIVAGTFASPSGSVRVFGPDGSLLGKDTFVRSFSSKNAEIALDLPSDGEYLIIISSRDRFTATFDEYQVFVREASL